MAPPWHCVCNHQKCAKCTQNRRVDISSTCRICPAMSLSPFHHLTLPPVQPLAPPPPPPPLFL